MGQPKKTTPWGEGHCRTSDGLSRQGRTDVDSPLSGGMWELGRLLQRRWHPGDLASWT